MKTITMYELLGMVKDGNVPKRIIYDQFVYVWNSKIENYQREVDEITTLNWDYITINCLNEPVEILNKSIAEEKKIPEKLKWNEKSQHNVVTDNTKKTLEHLLSRSEQLKKSINQIVDYLDYLKSKGE